MRTKLLYLGLALIIGIAIAAVFDMQSSPQNDTGDITAPQAFAMDPTSDQPHATGDTAAEILALRNLLEDEIERRRALEKKIESLGRQIATLQEQSSVVSRSDPGADTNGQADSGDPSSNEDWFNQQALIDSGMDSAQAEQLKLFFEQLEMERLMLRDKSRREGWNREQFGEAIEDIRTREDALRQQLGETGYDAYLYASGQPNRVAVTSVLDSAPAGSVGIQAGDHILRYDNQRIYNWFELRDATSGGAIDDTVSVEVERDGETLQFYVARGPLGIRMNPVSIAP